MIKSIGQALLLVMLLLAGVGVSAQTKDETAVASAVEELRKALVDPDKAVLDKLTAEDLSYGHSSGVVQDKAVFMDVLLTGKSDFTSMELTEQTIKIVGNAAIVRHHLSANILDGGKPGATKLAILMVWQKQKGHWKLLARQATKI